MDSLELMFDLPSIKLNPVTSLNTSRYDSNSACIELYSRVINRGPSSRSRSALEVSPSLTLPSPSDASHNTSTSTSRTHWQRYIHPEGQPYFVRNTEFDFAVVTEANICDGPTEELILGCIKAVHRELQCNGIKVPPRCELFLELGYDHTSCNYYFVDHVGKALFWLEDLCTELLGVPAAMSSSHLETALQKLYWVHVEFFPMHHESHEQEFSPIVEELYNNISHGQADRLTSRISTFPYTADTCTHFLKLLGRKKGQRMDGYTLCYAARLASAIMNQRFLTFYGQQPAQLDRLQEMCPGDACQEHQWLSTAADWLMWGTPQYYNNLLEGLYVNEQVYVDQWTHFISLCLADWTNSMSWSFPVFIASILLASVCGGTLFMSVLSGLSCSVSIASALYFYFTHQSLVKSTAAVGERYLRSAKSSTMRFIPLSIILSLPRASYLWGISFVIAQFFCIVSYRLGRFVALATAAIFAAILILVICIHRLPEVSVGFASLHAWLAAYDSGRDELMV